MTDLEKRADVYVSNKADKGNFDVEKFGKAYFSESSMKQALINFAKAETTLLSQHILDLQKDKGNLTDRVRELEQQIEKMKNWCNCKNYQQCLIELAEQGKGMKPSECCVNCKKWEIKER